MFLFETIEQSKLFGSYAELPRTIADNLNPEMKMRPYQEAAFRNYVTYFENPNLRMNGNRVLFHMATGSGKTYIMAGLIVYLYQKGYRNFLFFVPLSNIKTKTISNFTEPSSSKYLFAETIVIDGMRVPIKTVNSFQDSSPDSINICFTTIQQIHHDFFDVRENGITIDYFEDRKIVFISDEAHHLTVDTASSKTKSAENESRSWEYVVKNLFGANADNILIEFTATCKLDNPQIRQVYENKIVYQYDLKQFRHDRYSKEVQTMQTDLEFIDMSLQAMVLSQYRLHLFNDLKQDIKPVILFKSATKSDSSDFLEKFDRTIEHLTGEMLDKIAEVDAAPVRNAFEYFERNGITTDLLARELKEGFGTEHRIQVTDDSEVRSNDRLLSTLEEKDNVIRAIFEVKALDEGWDVLNLFDIVRLYDKRDSKNGIPGKTTISEAQLIGRGARYCPFIIDDPTEKYIRKFDEDLDNKYRICEEMYFHCHSNSKYIDELHKALVDTGMMDQNIIIRKLTLKDSFKKSNLYRSGSVLVNNQKEIPPGSSESLPPKIRDRIYHYTVPDKKASISRIFVESAPIEPTIETIAYSYQIRNIADSNYNTIYAALRRYPRFKLSNLQKLYPCITSMRQFITSDKFLGNIQIDILASHPPSQTDLSKACVKMAGEVSDMMGDGSTLYMGTVSFHPVPIKDMFYDKVVHYQNIDGEVGKSQSESAQWRLDLSNKDWYVFNDNYGTSEEKGFVKYLAERIEPLLKTYDEVYLVRNERQLHIYSFEGGSRFEPDFLLFLIRDSPSFNQTQIFIEPKGSQLIQKDQWKEDFLLEVGSWELEPGTLLDETEYTMIGFPFYNNTNHKRFDDAFKKILDSDSSNQSSK